MEEFGPDHRYTLGIHDAPSQGTADVQTTGSSQALQQLQLDSPRACCPVATASPTSGCLSPQSRAVTRSGLTDGGAGWGGVWRDL